MYRIVKQLPAVREYDVRCTVPTGRSVGDCEEHNRTISSIHHANNIRYYCDHNSVFVRGVRLVCVTFSELLQFVRIIEAAIFLIMKVEASKTSVATRLLTVDLTHQNTQHIIITPNTYR